MTFLVHISGQLYPVSDADVGEVESRILDAVHAGGAFVDLVGTSNRSVRALVSPATCVWIEELPPPAEPSVDDEQYPDMAFLNLDF